MSQILGSLWLIVPYGNDRYKLRLCLACLCLTRALHGQFNDVDPFAGGYRIAASDEIFVLIAPPEGGEVAMRILDANGPVENGLIAGPPRTVSGYRDRTGNVGQPAVVDAAALDLDGDRLDDIVTVWEGEGREVILSIPVINRGNMSIGNVASYKMSDFSFPLLREEENFEALRNVRVIPAQLDTDASEEFIITWWAEDDSIQIVAFKMDGDGLPQVIASVNDVSISYPEGGDARSIHTQSNKFALCAGEFDETYGNEIVLVYPTHDYSDQYHIELTARAYRLMGNEGDQRFEVAADLAEPLYRGPSRGNYALYRLSVTAGDMDGDGLDEGVVGFTLADPSGSVATTMSLHYFEGDETLSTLAPMAGGPHQIEQTQGQRGFPMSVSAGDYNNDEFVDVGYFSRQGFKSYSKWNGSTYNESGHYSLSGGSSHTDDFMREHRVVSVTDLDADADTDFEGEAVIITSREIYEQNNPNPIGIDVLVEVRRHLVSGVVAEWSERLDINRPPSLALVTGDFDGDSIQLGRPTIYRRSEIVQPVMILNAPPIHFDILNGVTYDVNKCFYNDNPLVNCQATATYTLQNTVVQEINTEVRADWAVSTGIETSVEGKVLAVRGKLTASLDYRYGEGFAKSRKSSTTISETKQFIAEADDLIYATVADYDILEYPVLENGSSIGTIVSVIPKAPRLITFNSKSPRAAGYISPHEPGNILSYRSQTAAGDNPLVDRPVKEFQGFIWEMQPSGNSQWTLQLTEFTQNALTYSNAQSLSARVEVEFEVGGDIPIVDDIVGSFSSSINAYLQGDYSTSSVNTHTTTLTTSHTLHVNFGNIDGAILGNTTYEVLPYLYWARNGALVLDYAVNPVIGDSFEGWWQLNYAQKPDLAFTLPSRYDRERGLNISEIEAIRTKNIQTNPANPRAGDTVDLFARVHNYSLQTGGAPESVLRFYLGDPADGGVLLANADGKSDVLIPPIPPRGYRVVSLRDWVVPWTVQQNTRLFAVIDPANAVDEIHKNNNKGWAPLNASGGSLWPMASTYPDGWLESPWMGWMNDRSFPYVFHLKMGYFYAASFSNPDSLFYWDVPLGTWCWSSPDFWPYIYLYSKFPGWHFYYEATSSPGRWFYHVPSGVFVQEHEFGG